MPYYTRNARTIVSIAIAIVVVEIECPSIRIVIVASTFEGRVSRVNKVRVSFSFIPILILNATFTLA